PGRPPRRPAWPRAGGSSSCRLPSRPPVRRIAEAARVATRATGEGGRTLRSGPCPADVGSVRAYLRHLPLPARVLLGASALLAVLPVLDVVRQAPALGLSEDARGWVYVLVLGLAAAACAERVRRRPEERAGWLLISAGLALWVLAQAWWQV